MLFSEREFFSNINTTAEFNAFKVKHSSAHSFWADCPRADWMWWLLLYMLDAYNRDMLAAIKSHQKFWDFYIYLLEYDKRLNPDSPILDGFLSKDDVGRFLGVLQKEVEDNTVILEDMEWRSWLGAETWTLPAIHAFAEAAGRSKRFEHDVMARFHKSQDLGRRLTAEEEAEIDAQGKATRQQAVLNLYEHLAGKMREIIGNPF